MYIAVCRGSVLAGLHRLPVVFRPFRAYGGLWHAHFQGLWGLQRSCFQFGSDASCHGVGGSPCCLEVEATCHTIDVEHLACIEEVGCGLRFEGGFVHTVEGNAATGDKLVLVGTATCNGVGVVAELVSKAVDAFLAQFAAPLALQTRLAEQVGPKSGGEKKTLQTFSPAPSPVEGEGNRARCWCVCEREAEVVDEFVGVLLDGI